MGSLSPLHWIVVLVIVVLVFGTKKLRNAGKDLGSAIHDFKEGLNQGGETPKEPDALTRQNPAAEETEKKREETSV